MMNPYIGKMIYIGLEGPTYKVQQPLEAGDHVQGSKHIRLTNF